MELPKKTPQQLRDEALTSLNDLKRDIDLVNFAIHKFNYIPDWLHPGMKGHTIKSSENSIKLVHKDDTMDSIVVSRNSANSQFIYFSVLNSGDRGSILDFVKYRIKDKFSIPNFRKICKNYTQALEKNLFPDTGLDIKKTFKTIPSASNVPNVAYYEQILSPLENKSYFLSRGIQNDVSLKYASNCYNHYGWKKDEEHNHQVISVVFPYYKAEKDKLVVHTYQRYNQHEKKFIRGDKDNSVWIGSFDKSKPISSLVISESPIDTISIAALKPDLVGPNPVLSASGGQYTKGIVELYSNINTMTKAENLILANDNDCKGQQYNAFLLCKLNSLPFLDADFIDKNKGLVNADIDCGVNDKKGYLEWTFSHDKLQGTDIDKQIQNIPAFVQVRDFYLELNKSLVGINDEKVIFNVDHEYKDNLSRVKVSFNNTQVNWEAVSDSLVNLKFNYSENLIIEKSVGKDFNQDLKLYQGLEKFDIADKDKYIEFNQVYPKVNEKNNIGQSKGFKI